MGTPPKTMTTREFSELTGVPPSEVANLIREGKLKAKKEAGKWAIPESQLSSKWVKGQPKPARTPAPPRAAASAVPAVPAPTTPADSTPSEATYSVAEFSAMSYLTEKGVAEWLKIGRLKGVKTESGEWRVLGRNLQVPDILRLLRK